MLQIRYRNETKARKCIKVSCVINIVFLLHVGHSCGHPKGGALKSVDMCVCVCVYIYIYIYI
jgi:hypothetical protein